MGTKLQTILICYLLIQQTPAREADTLSNSTGANGPAPARRMQVETAAVAGAAAAAGAGGFTLSAGDCIAAAGFLLSLTTAIHDWKNKDRRLDNAALRAPMASVKDSVQQFLFWNSPQPQPQQFYLCNDKTKHCAPSIIQDWEDMGAHFKNSKNQKCRKCKRKHVDGMEFEMDGHNYRINELWSMGHKPLVSGSGGHGGNTVVVVPVLGAAALFFIIAGLALRWRSRGQPRFSTVADKSEDVVMSGDASMEE